jgi:AcrR family transcriptional regulator
MKATAKLSSEERRAAILKAVGRVFAEKGFHGTTTRELAKAAGVSEALLFKHFPNKEALFSAMKTACCDEQDILRFERVTALAPCALTLVQMVHLLVSVIVRRCASRGDDERVIVHRLTLRSLAEDGEFARVLHRRLAEEWVPKIEECLRVAAAAGEAFEGPVLPGLGGWLSHHLAAMLGAYLLPATAVVDYGLPPEQLVVQVAWFALRGLGLKEEAIRRYYTPEARASAVG